MRTRGKIPQRKPKIVVRSLCAGATRGTLTYGNLTFPCALGRSGRRSIKREGDGATPIGRLAIHRAHYRPDRLLRPAGGGGVPISPLRPSDGWCDAPTDRNYNRPVRHPYPASAEHMWRSDRLYDVVLVLGYNLKPRIAGRGSAIFMHATAPGMKPTEGCIALEPQHLRRLVSALRKHTVLDIPR